MADKQITIYLVTAALQAVAVDQLRKCSPNTSLVINFSTIQMSPSGCSEVIEMSSSGPLNTICKYRRLATRLSDITNHYGRIDVAVPHLFHLVANHLFHKTLRGKITFLPDGTLNLTPRQLRPRERRKMILKCIVAPILGFRYQMYHGSLHGFDGYTVDRVVTYFEGAFFPACRHMEILRLGKAASIDPRACLVVDQDLGKILRARNKVKDVRNAIARVTENYSTVMVKLRPNQSEPEIAPKKHGVIYIDPKLPIELALLEYHPAAVIGNSSTALATLKLLNPNIKCIVVGLNRVEEVIPEMRYYRDFLTKLNANFLDM